MSAMTWYDHQTNSIWSQPWGRAIRGPLKGIQLFLLPSQVTTWDNWRTAHPNTLVMTNDINLMPNLRHKFRPDFVIGVIYESQARAYPYELATAETLIQDTLGDTPILIWAANNDFRAYIRRLPDQILTFQLKDDMLIDEQTNTTWDPIRGLAISGPLTGQVLATLPTITAFADHWTDFYPNGEIYSAP